MSIPDVTAYRLDQAVEMLKKKGVKFNLKKIAPPIVRKKGNIPEQTFGAYRVLKQDIIGNSLLELTVAKEQKSKLLI
ncbi:MAG: hypothetical protein ACOX6X_00030 [Dethiobacteria bacterium]|jgi:beta-lactam-binding protein with PASTA domain